jgi:hypothetical protein
MTDIKLCREVLTQIKNKSFAGMGEIPIATQDEIVALSFALTVLDEWEEMGCYDHKGMLIIIEDLKKTNKEVCADAENWVSHCEKLEADLARMKEALEKIRDKEFGGVNTAWHLREIAESALKGGEA